MENTAKNRPMPIGISDFRELLEKNYYFVDKSLFIRDLLEDGSKVILLPRPRRFGKTLNLDMLKVFLKKMERTQKNFFMDFPLKRKNALHFIRANIRSFP